jgi:hypothetical protein
MKSEPKLNSLQGNPRDTYIVLSNNTKTGGTCFGDSGGPKDSDLVEPIAIANHRFGPIHIIRPNAPDQKNDPADAGRLVNTSSVQRTRDFLAGPDVIGQTRCHRRGPNRRAKATVDMIDAILDAWPEPVPAEKDPVDVAASRADATGG